MAEAWGGELLAGGDNDIKAAMEITGMRACSLMDQPSEEGLCRTCP